MKKTMNRLLKAANAGDADAQFEAGLEYFNQEEYIKAAYYYQLAVEQGHTGAMVRLGLMYCVPSQLPCNYKEAERLIRLAIKSGDKDAQYRLVVVFMLSKTEDEHRDEVVDICKRLAKEGHIDAIEHLADMYAMGRGVEQNVKEALRLYNQAIEAGSEDAMYILGMEYAFFNVVVKRDSKEGRRLLKMAASRDHVDAMFALGWSYEREDEYDEALKYYCKAADQGSKEAQFQLAYNYHRENNLPKAEQFYKLAVKQGEGAAYNNLAALYASTDDTDKLEKAEELFKQCNDDKYMAKYSDKDMLEYNNKYMVQYNLALLYHKLGKMNDAKKLYRKLLDAFNEKNYKYKHIPYELKSTISKEELNYHLALLLSTTGGNPKEIRALYQKGGSYAYNNLAMMYATGIGGERDLNKAVKLLEKAVAKDDNDEAFRNLYFVKSCLEFSIDPEVLNEKLKPTQLNYKFLLESQCAILNLWQKIEFSPFSMLSNGTITID